MRKRFTRILAALALLVFMMPSMVAWGQTKITNPNDIVDGKTYYIGATVSNTDYYLYVYHSAIGPYYGAGKTDISEATTFTFEAAGDNWKIKFSDNGKYLGTLPSDNGKLQISNSGEEYTATSQNSLIRLSNSSRSIQRNTSNSDRFGSYANTQKDIWLMEVTPTCTPSLISLAFEGVIVGQSASKTFTLTTANLTDDIDLLVYDDAAFTVSPTSIAVNATSTEVTVTFHPTLVTNWTDALIISSDDFNDVELVGLTGEGLCDVPTTALAYTTPINLTLSGDDVNYTLNPTSGTGNGGTITYTLTTNPGGNGMVEGNVFTAVETGQYVVRATQALNGITCGGEFDITINVNGTAPVCTIEPEIWDFENVAVGESANKSFTVTTANLTGSITLAMDNAAFSVSPSTILQDATSTEITITFAPTTAGAAESYLTANGGGINNNTLAYIGGTGATPSTITFNPGTGSCTVPSMTGMAGTSITLPLASTVTAPEGWEFAGWCATEITAATTTEPTLVAGSYTISGDATLFAVYSKTEGSAGSFEYVFKDQGYTNAQVIYSAEMDATSGIGWSATKGGNNEPAYYDTGTGLRVYSGGTFSVTTNDNTITAVSLTFSSNNYTFSSSVTDNPTTWSGSQSTDINWSVSRTCRLQKVNVTYNNSTTTYHTYPTAKVATPTIEIAGVSTGTANTYYETVTVTLNCTTVGATIHYTTNGDTPTASSATYSEPFTVTENSTIKAIAIKDGYDNSNVTVPQTITIVQPNMAEFTNGVYTSLNSSTDLNKWNIVNISGDNTWFWYSMSGQNCARMTISYSNEDWLISPKMTVSNTPISISFDCAVDYGKGDEGAIPSALYSTDYPGYGNPTSYTWTKLQDLPNDNNLTFEELSMRIPATTQVCFAIKYVSTSTDATTLEIENFTAKQCYTVTYNANGGTGDPITDGPYAVGAEVTARAANTFTAPEGKVFERWSDGVNNYSAGAPFTMPNAALVLNAQWKVPCTLKATMAATEGEAVYDYNGGDKRYNISMSSSVSALGGCGITEYGFVYSTSETTPTLENATKLAVGTEYTEANTTFNAVIENTTGTYYVRAFATNEAGTAYSESAAIVVVPGTYPTWTISYTTNGVAEATTHTVYQGATIGELLAEPTAANVPDGFTFKGWYAEEYYNASAAPTYVAVGDAVIGNMTLKAVFAKETTSEVELNLEMTATNFTELGGSYGKYTHIYPNVATIEVYSCKQSSAFQINKGKSVYFKNTSAMPGYITKFVIAWNGTPTNNTITMYANDNSVASTSTTNVGAPSAGASQTITIENASTNNYKYFYMDPETVSGGCKITSFKIYYMDTETTSSNYCTRVYTKDIAGYGSGNDKWYLIASPVAGSLAPTSVVNLVGKQIQTEPTVLYDFDLYRYNSLAEKEWENYNNATHHDGFVLENGMGYLYAHQTLVTLSFPGMTYSGNGEVTMANAGWNLVGNPYGTTASVDKDFYRMNTDGNEIVQGSGSIAPMEGIFVEAEQDDDIVTFSLPDGNAAPNSNPSVVMNVTQNRSNVIDRAVVRFSDGSNLPKFQLFDHSTKLCIQQGTEEYAVVRSNGQGEMPVNFKAYVAGEYTITVNPEDVEMGYLHLIDNIAGKDVDLIANPSYTFNALTDDYESRFRLVFSTTMVNAEMGEDFAFMSDGQLVIANEGEATLQVIDVTGRVVATENINGTCSKAINAKAGVYVLRLVNGTDVKTQKMVIR